MSPTYRTNQYPGTCEHYGQLVPAGMGQVRRDRRRNRFTRHYPAEKVGWPEPVWIYGCPPPPPEPEDGAAPVGDAPAGPGLEAAREWLYRRYYRNRTPPSWREPHTDAETEKQDAAVLRLAALHPIKFLSSTHHTVELIRIAETQGWVLP